MRLADPPKQLPPSDLQGWSLRMADEEMRGDRSCTSYATTPCDSSPSIKAITRTAPEMRHQFAGCVRPLVQAIRVPSGRHSAMMYPEAGGVRL